MTIEIDFEASRKVADDVDLELDRLRAEFEACDRLANDIAALVRGHSASVAEAIVDVTAREGAHRTKPMAEAQEAPWTLRRALGEFERFNEPLARELHDLGERIGQTAQEAWGDAQRIGDAVWDKAKDVGSEAKHVGEAVWDKAKEVGDDAKDAVEDFVHDLTGKEEKKGARFRDPEDH